MLGQEDFQENYDFNLRQATSATPDAPQFVTSVGSRLVVADGHNRILVWNDPPPSSNMAPADLLLGQRTANTTNYNNGGLSGHSLYLPTGIIVDNDLLYIADKMNDRILVMPLLPLF